jgi:ATP-binding cassette subfamily C (CFTR/MRP) protein 1
VYQSAPLSFFTKTDTGSIVNRYDYLFVLFRHEPEVTTIFRFSQDIQLIDKQLPLALANVATCQLYRILAFSLLLTLTELFKLLVQISLLFIAQKWLLTSLPACIMVVYIVQKMYLRPSRQLRFLDLESRAEVFSSFLELVYLYLLLVLSCGTMSVA